MPLYQGTITQTIYVWTDETSPTAIRQEARDRLEALIANEGVIGTMQVSEVKMGDPIADGWDPADLVPGTADITGDEQLSLSETLQFTGFREGRH